MIIAAVALSGSGQQPQTGLQVSFDGTPQTWNNTTPQQLNWGSVAPSMSYTKNVSVTNQYPDSVTLILLTTEPAGSHQSWPKNNTVLAGNRSTTGDLTLSTDASITSGDYTWLLIASNSTAEPTPTPSPTATGLKPKYNYTVTVEGVGVQQVTVHNANTGATTTIPEAELLSGSVTYVFSQGDVLTFTAAAKTGYAFNVWIYDGEPRSNPLTVTPTANIALTAKFLPTPTPTATP